MDNLRILLVDDEKNARILVRRMFHGLGYTLDESPDGADGFERLKSATIPYDLVIIDLTMPHMNGLQLIKTIRCNRNGINPETKIVLTSSVKCNTILNVALQLDINGFLYKPYSKARLLDAIKKAIRINKPMKSVKRYRAVPLCDVPNP